MKHTTKAFLQRLCPSPGELSQRTDLSHEEATELLQIDGSPLNGRLHHRALLVMCITDADREATLWLADPVRLAPRHVLRALTTFAEAKELQDRAMKRGDLLAAHDGATAMWELATTERERGIAYNAAGGVHRSLGNLEAARRNYEAGWRLLKDDPVWGPALMNNRALVDNRLGLFDTARFLSEGVLANPHAKAYRRAWAWMCLGEIAIAERDWTAAEQAFRTASSLFAEAHVNRRVHRPESPETSPEQYSSLIHLAFAQAKMGIPGAAEQLARWCSEPEVEAEDPESAMLAKILHGALNQDSSLLIAARDRAHEAQLIELGNIAAHYLRALMSVVVLLIGLVALTPAAVAASPTPQQRIQTVVSKHDTGDEDLYARYTPFAPFTFEEPTPPICTLDALVESFVHKGSSPTSWFLTCMVGKNTFSR